MKTKTALVGLLKESRDLRIFFKGCCNASAFRLRAQGWQFRNELAERYRGTCVPLNEVQDTLFELARDLFPESPAADFSAWAELLCRDALARIQEHYTDLSANQKDALDLSRAWEYNEAVVEACRSGDRAALRDAVRAYECEALAALEETKKASGAA